MKIKQFAILFTLIAIVIVSGCVADLSPREIAKATDVGQAFFRAYPNAELNAGKYPIAFMRPFIEDLQKSCPDIELKEYWRISAYDLDSDLSAVIWIDAESMEPTCFLKSSDIRLPERNYNITIADLPKNSILLSPLNLAMVVVSDPWIQTVGNDVKLEARVFNLGDVSTGPFLTEFRYDGSIIYAETVSDLKPATGVGPNDEPKPAAIIQTDWSNSEAGYHDITVQSGDYVSAMRSLYLYDDGIDLALMGDVIYDYGNYLYDKAIEQEIISFKAGIPLMNLGSTDSESFDFEIRDPDIGEVIYTSSSPGIEGGRDSRVNTNYFTLNISLRENTSYYLKNLVLNIDPENKITEVDETNNMKEFTVVIPKKADLVTQNSIGVKPGARLTLSVYVKNKGTVGTNDFIVQLWSNGLIDEKIVNLEPTQDIFVDFVWDGATVGEHNFKIVVDSDDDVEEADETNNVAFVYNQRISQTDFSGR
ncbi:MAG: hypothetical protein KJ906_01545 [Nanoarchaeota archaeon]|nr:hypothetical protein [Nanoarchaeota archaeon]